jgi:hypothetical protein
MPGAVRDENGSEVARNVTDTSNSPPHWQGQWTCKPVEVSASRPSDWTNPGLQTPRDRQNQIKPWLKKLLVKGKVLWPDPVVKITSLQNILASAQNRLSASSRRLFALLILNLHAEMNTNATTAVTRIMITVFLAQQYV